MVVCVFLRKYVLGGSTSHGPGWIGGAAPRVTGPYNPATEPEAFTGLKTRFGRCGEPPLKDLEILAGSTGPGPHFEGCQLVVVLINLHHLWYYRL